MAPVIGVMPDRVVPCDEGKATAAAMPAVPPRKPRRDKPCIDSSSFWDLRRRSITVGLAHDERLHGGVVVRMLDVGAAVPAGRTAPGRSRAARRCPGAGRRGRSRGTHMPPKPAAPTVAGAPASATAVIMPRHRSLTRPAWSPAMHRFTTPPASAFRTGGVKSNGGTLGRPSASSSRQATVNVLHAAYRAFTRAHSQRTVLWTRRIVGRLRDPWQRQAARWRRRRR
jgi:hypothetical protein